jgi:hypothetical protein
MDIKEEKVKSDLYIFGPFGEFHAFMKFNMFLFQIKNEYNKIIAIVPEKAIDIVSNADEIISISNEYLDERNANYPEVLNLLGNRNISDFFPKAKKYISEVKSDNSIVLHYDVYKISDNAYPTFNTSDLGDCYKRDFKYISDWLSNGGLLYPRKSVFESVEDKFSQYENHFVIITRNFSKKQPDTNTSSVFPQTEELLRYLTDRGVKILNIGFPCQSYNIENNYTEFNGPLTHGELMSIFYMAKGVIVFGLNGGFSVNISSNVNLFNLSEEWSKGLGISLIDARKNNNNIETKDFKEFFNDNDFESIYKGIRDVKKVNTIFSEEKNIVFIDKLINNE